MTMKTLNMRQFIPLLAAFSLVFSVTANTVPCQCKCCDVDFAEAAPVASPCCEPISTPTPCQHCRPSLDDSDCRCTFSCGQTYPNLHLERRILDSIHSVQTETPPHILPLSPGLSIDNTFFESLLNQPHFNACVQARLCRLLC